MIKTDNAEVIEFGVLSAKPTEPDPMCLHGCVVMGSGDSEGEAFKNAHDQLHKGLLGTSELALYLIGHFTWTDKVKVAAREQGYDDGEQVYIAIRTTNG